MPLLRRPGQRPVTTNGIFSYEVEWEKLEVGMSFFIPTHDPQAVQAQLYWQGRKYGYSLIFRHLYYKGYFGVMTWRGSDGYVDPDPNSGDPDRDENGCASGAG